MMLFYGTLSIASKKTMTDMLDQLVLQGRGDSRTRSLLDLALISPEFAIQR